jgi:hypothetical protein
VDAGQAPHPCAPTAYRSPAPQPHLTPVTARSELPGSLETDPHSHTSPSRLTQPGPNRPISPTLPRSTDSYGVLEHLQ